MGDVLAIVALRTRATLEPGVEDLAQSRLRGQSQAERQHVGVIPFPGARGGLRVGAQRRADAGQLVGRDRRAGSGPASHNRLFGAAVVHVSRSGLGGPGPIVTLGLGVGAMEDGLVPPAPKLLGQGGRHAGQLVCRDGDPHWQSDGDGLAFVDDRGLVLDLGTQPLAAVGAHVLDQWNQGAPL